MLVIPSFDSDETLNYGVNGEWVVVQRSENFRNRSNDSGMWLELSDLLDCLRNVVGDDVLVDKENAWLRHLSE